MALDEIPNDITKKPCLLRADIDYVVVKIPNGNSRNSPARTLPWHTNEIRCEVMASGVLSKKRCRKDSLA